MSDDVFCCCKFQGDKFSKGLLALGFKPGEGCVAVIGCPSLYAGVGLYVAAASLGVAFAVR